MEPNPSTAVSPETPGAGGPNSTPIGVNGRASTLSGGEQSGLTGLISTPPYRAELTQFASGLSLSERSRRQLVVRGEELRAQSVL